MANLELAFAHPSPRSFKEVKNEEINFTKHKKNPASTPMLKVVQTKISLKAKSPPPANGMVIREPSPNFGRPTTLEVVGAGAGNEKVVEPPSKVKPTSNQAFSSYKTTQLGSASGEKRPSSDSKSRLAKKQ
ncbi:hypothetical protein Fot_42233 [Forsythia ovata]|uniref:Uncharacterized protein n=1 Tax=Forsythia ovata TaxID=205694 RepID=A0ABD1RLC1_9LAMI